MLKFENRFKFRPTPCLFYVGVFLLCSCIQCIHIQYIVYSVAQNTTYSVVCAWIYTCEWIHKKRAQEVNTSTKGRGPKFIHVEDTTLKNNLDAQIPSPRTLELVIKFRWISVLYATLELGKVLQGNVRVRFRPSMCNNLHKVLLVCQTSAGLKNPPGKCNIGNVD